MGNGLLLASVAVVSLSICLVSMAHVASTWLLFPLGMVFGASGTAQLTPVSTLLDSIVPEALHEHPTFGYALFNCAYVSGMAIGPGALSALTESHGFETASLILGSATTAVALSAALVVRQTRDIRGSARREVALQSVALDEDE